MKLAQWTFGRLIALLLFTVIFSLTSAQGETQAGGGAVKNDHHTEEGYTNSYLKDEKSFFDLLRWKFGARKGSPDELPTGLNLAEHYSPDSVAADLALISTPTTEAIQLSWIGHAAFLVQVGGVNILTDPQFSDRSSPFSFVGPKRVAPPGISLKDLPRIDVAIISHDHYDSLDVDSVIELGNDVHFLVPLGLKRWFENLGITNVTELDWWQVEEYKGINFHLVPAQHWSKRTPWGTNSTLWGGWVIQSSKGNIYFVGDSGYDSRIFTEIGERLGPMKLSLIPIGAYRPRWFMKPMHVDPFEAVRIHQDVKSELSIAMHWGTFKLTDEPLNEPPALLERALKESSIPTERFRVLKFGETLVVK